MLKTKDLRAPVVALIDFGMSKWSSSDGMAGGTPGYRPPETNETNVWFPRGDIFSLGVTYFQLLADKVPDEQKQTPGIFTEGAQTMEQVNYFVKTREPPWFLIKNKYPGVMSWLSKMLDKQLTNRPKAPNLFNNPWFKAKGAAKDAIMPETGWIAPMMDDDDDDEEEATTVTEAPLPQTLRPSTSETQVSVPRWAAPQPVQSRSAVSQVSPGRAAVAQSSPGRVVFASAKVISGGLRR